MKSERLAYWYFRLNGFLTSQNYIIHPGKAGSQRTEIDILGVRFPYKAERIYKTECDYDTMVDEDIFIQKDEKKPYIIIADATIGHCKLNPSWITPAKKNIHDFMRVVGAFEDKDSIIDPIAKELYENGFYENDSYCISLFCFGKSEDKELKSKYPRVPQKTWDEVLEFIYKRFNRYEELKSDHSQWDCDGKQLWNCSKCNTKSKFIYEIISCLEPG